MTPREMFAEKRERMKRKRVVFVLSCKWRSAFFWRMFDQLVREGM